MRERELPFQDSFGESQEKKEVSIGELFEKISVSDSDKADWRARVSTEKEHVIDEIIAFINHAVKENSIDEEERDVLVESLDSSLDQLLGEHVDTEVIEPIAETIDDDETFTYAALAEKRNIDTEYNFSEDPEWIDLAGMSVDNGDGKNVTYFVKAPDKNERLPFVGYYKKEWTREYGPSYTLVDGNGRIFIAPETQSRMNRLEELGYHEFETEKMNGKKQKFPEVFSKGQRLIDPSNNIMDFDQMQKKVQKYPEKYEKTYCIKNGMIFWVENGTLHESGISVGNASAHLYEWNKKVKSEGYSQNDDLWSPGKKTQWLSLVEQAKKEREQAAE